MTLRQMSGAGNRFLVGTAPEVPVDVPRLIATHQRRDGLPIEGVLFVHRQATPQAVLRIEYINPDGTTGMMCGNGTRCAVRYAADSLGAPVGTPLSISVNGAAYQARVLSDQDVELVLPPPRTVTRFPVGSLEGVDRPVVYVDVNSDHVVVEHLASQHDPLVAVLRHHPQFPRGVNVNMASVEHRGKLRLATFERGVEAVTAACGTGAVSSVVALWQAGALDDRVIVIPPSGRPLYVVIEHGDEHPDHITAIRLVGDALYDEPPSTDLR